MLSGSPDEGDQPGEVSLRVELARELRVPVEAIIAERTPQAGDEPPRTERRFAYGGWLPAETSVLLGTDSQQMRRARHLFERLGSSVLAAPIDGISLDTSSPEERLKLVRWISGEWLAQVYYTIAR